MNNAAMLTIPLKSNTRRARLHRYEAAEMWLIRSGQHLFIEWRRKGRTDKDLEAAFECIWQLKRELRASKDQFVKGTL
jgi:hypothetical protein